MSFQLIRKSGGTITTLTHLGVYQESKISKFREPRFKNAKFATYEESKSFAFETISFLCNLLALMLTLLYNEQANLISSPHDLRFVSDSLAFSCIVACLFTLLSIHCDSKINKLSDDNFEQQTSWSELKFHLLKSLLVILHPSQFFASLTLLNDILAAVSYLRIIFIYSFLVKITRYHGTRAGRILSLYGHKAKNTSIKFAIKCLFKQKGLISNIFVLFFATVVLALVTMTVNKGADLLGQVYLCLITMATVGYGDQAGDSTGEKMILLLVIISGSFASSVMTVYFLRFFDLDDKEFRAHQLIKRLSKREKINENKIMRIKTFLRKDNKKASYFWRSLEREIENEKQTIYSFTSSNFFNSFCNGIKLLVEKQLLTQHLVYFYFQRRRKYEEEQARQKSERSKGLRRRAEDSKAYNEIRKSILGVN